MGSSPKMQPLAITLGLALAAFMVGRNMVIQPAKSMVMRLKMEKQTEERKGQAIGRIADFERQINAGQSGLLPKTDASAFIEMLNRMAEDSGVSLTSVTPFPVEKMGSYARLPIQVEMRCSYHQVGRFLSKLESSSTFIKVEVLQIRQPPEVRTAESAEPEEPKLSVVILLNGLSRAEAG